MSVQRFEPDGGGASMWEDDEGHFVLATDFDALAKRLEEAERDAARYRWLRADNAYAPEEYCVTGGEELDALCDRGIQVLENRP